MDRWHVGGGRYVAVRGQPPAGTRRVREGRARSLARRLVADDLRTAQAMLRAVSGGRERWDRANLDVHLVERLAQAFLSGRVVVEGRLDSTTVGAGATASPPSVPSRPPSRPPTRRPTRVDPELDVVDLMLVTNPWIPTRRGMVRVGVSEPFDGQSVLECSRSDVRVFRQMEGGAPLQVLSFTSNEITAGRTLWVELDDPSGAPEDVVFTLRLSGGPKPVGPPAVAATTAARLTLRIFTDPRSPGGEAPLGQAEQHEDSRLIPRRDPDWVRDSHLLESAAFDETRGLEGVELDHPRAKLTLMVEPASLQREVRLRATSGGAHVVLHESPEELAPRVLPYVTPIGDLATELWISGAAPGTAELGFFLEGVGLGDFVRVTSVDARLGLSPDGNRFGYDDMDNLPGRIHHVSVAAGDTTAVALAIDGVDPDTLSLSVTGHPLDTVREGGDVVVRGMAGVQKEASILCVHLGDASQPVIAAIAVHTYRLIGFDVDIVPVFHSDPAEDPPDASPTQLDRSRFEIPDIEPVSFRDRINALLAPLCLRVGQVRVENTRFVPYDSNGSGIMEYGFRAQLQDRRRPVDESNIVLTEHQEKHAASNASGDTATVFLVRELQRHQRVITPLFAGATRIQVDSLQSFFFLGVDYQLTGDFSSNPPPPGGGEIVRFTEQNGNVYTLATPLRRSYAVAALMFDTGGFSLSFDDPRILLDNSPDRVPSVMVPNHGHLVVKLAHELIHTVGHLLHGHEPPGSPASPRTNLMDGTNVGPRLRYKRLPNTFVFDPAEPSHFERQWDKVPRNRTTAFPVPGAAQDGAVRLGIDHLAEPCI